MINQNILLLNPHRLYLRQPYLVLLVILNLKNCNTVELLAMIDTEISRSHIDISLVPIDCLQILSQPIFTEQMDETKLRYDKCTRDTQIKFLHNKKWIWWILSLTTSMS